MSMPGAIVAIEFTGLGPEHSFDRLLGLTAGIRVDPLDWLTECPLSLPQQVDRLLGWLPAAPRVVLGHCTAARLAVLLAASAATPEPPLVVLLDPDPVSPAYLWEEFVGLCAGLGGQPGQRILPGESGPERLAAMEARLADLADGLRVAYGDDADAAELTAELLGRYAAWLRFLESGSGAAPVGFAGQVVVISSGETPPRLDEIVRSSRITCLPGCAPEGKALLSSPAACRAVAEILRGAGAGPAEHSGIQDPQPNEERIAANVKPRA